MTENADTNKEVKTMEENPTIKLEVTEAEESKSNREETTKGENPAINMELTDDEETSMKLIIDEDAESNEDITMEEVNEINVHETPTEESNCKREERTKAENPAINMESTDDEETSMKLIIDEDAESNEDITMKEVDETNVNETVTDNIGNNAELNAEDENMPRKYVFDLDYGFKKVTVMRLNGKTKGKYDVFLISPKNKRLRSMREVEEYLTKHYPNIPLNHFDLKNPLDSRVKHKTTGIPNEIISIKEAKNVSLTTKTRSSKRARKTTPKISSKKPNKETEDDNKFKCTEVTLEHGFKKLIKERISEDKASKSYVIIVTPEGRNIRGYPELHKYMKANYPQLPHNLFDLKKPLEMIENDRRKRKLEASASEPPVKKLKTSTTENEEFDVTLVLPKNKGDLYKVRNPVSFDICNLFTCLDHKLVLTTLEKTLTDFNLVLPSNTISYLIEICLEFSYFCFNNNIYRQVNGIRMGSPLSPFLADLVLNCLDILVNERFNTTIKYWARYVDDVMAIVATDHMENTLAFLNSFHPLLKFTTGNESNGYLPFLDILFENKLNYLQTTVFRKPSHPPVRRRSRFARAGMLHTTLVPIDLESSGEFIFIRYHDFCNMGGERLTLQVEQTIRTLSKEGNSYSVIVKKLKAEGLDVGKATICRVVNGIGKKREAESNGQKYQVDRPRPVRIPATVSKVKRLATTKNPPSQRQLSRMCGTSLKTINNIIHKDLELDTRRKGKVHKLTPFHMKNRATNARKLYEEHLAGSRSEYTATLDEAWMYVTYCNGIRKICYIKRGNQVPDNWVHQCSETFPKGFMVVGVMTGRGVLPLIKVPSKVKVNSEFYIECVLKPVIEQLKDLYPGEMDKVFLHHDKASSHTSKKTQQFLQEMKDTLGLNFIRNSDIPVKTPDASPLDFYGFGMLKQRLFNRRPKTEAGLWKAAQEEWSNVSLSKVKEVFAAWKVRCREIAKKKGKHIEHMKKFTFEK
ncbi:hypothetical protein LAZ67_9002511 [Cordylochernes scorpioides]|uniref:Uncharacterized protein n=1 Tax=Cordylochernes scorpioides TaxID=51811 RepID=A0ABY6KTV7_9ARAC|nr:hypothetical protein LAZ67_9002511 [Cordylochernes scorpioides]